MRWNISGSSCAAILVSAFLFAPAAQAQVPGAPPAGGQNGNMNQPGMSPNNMQPTPGMRQQNNAQSSQEQAFLATMRRNAEAETELSKLALKQSGNDNVKKFAQQVISDNRKAEGQLDMSASNAGVSFAPPIPEETRKAEKQMKKQTGTQFDGMYLAQMDAYVKNDQKTVGDSSLTNSSQDLQSLTMRLRTQADERAQQIAQLAQSENIKIQ